MSYYEDVYAVVKSIPEGRVSTYGMISNFLTLGSARMVGWALRQLTGHESDIPAHRVVNSKGELSGSLHFGNHPGMAELLKMEGIEVLNNKVVDFEKHLWNPSMEIQ